MTVDVVHLTDPACPWAYSASPALAVLRWRFGDGLRWRLTMIGLRELEALDQAGYDPVASGARRLGFGRRFGMPVGQLPRPRQVATARGCRAVVAARLRHPGREDAVFRALQFAWATSDRLLDTGEAVLEAIAGVAGIDASAIAGALDDPEVTEAYAADRALARTAEGSPCEAMGRSARSDGPVRYTAPSLLFERQGRSLDAGGFQHLDAYDTCIANLAPELERRPPAATASEALAPFPDGLTTQEVAAIMTPHLADADRPAAERGLIQAAADGRARRVPIGNDALWLPLAG
jgi:protein-disulfide isomerase-like protein with CxxC motif